MATPQHADEIYRILEDEICSLKTLPGETLSENQLCKRFEVSRTPIRSVLQKLEQNGFVQIIPCKGTIVTQINIRVVDQIIYQRLAIESMVLRDFLQSCSAMDLLEIAHRNDLLRAAAGDLTDKDSTKSFDFNRFLACDLGTHQYWFCKTGKDYLWQQLTRPHADYSRFIRLDGVGAKNVQHVLAEHDELLRILREKDEGAIVPLMRKHLYGGITRMGGKLYSDEYKGYFSVPQTEAK